ncbi:GNAT family N-acetyltransferase [Actinophytocola oryzae]|uniref:Acetyltransferase (GNAT) family protein n=1 Tax=Actinophytocola oryzae TaxID=502181 RepID=A0A4R7VUQ4_9PSEU|nr:GNAT family N-acetyltransferase [Actinophytocola oryzae]TDV53713.1 acetyltransferase (GNAT) family protein [Actinophytocola oryzae]
MRELHIREARETDLAALTGEMGQRPFFIDRLERQARNHGVLLTAWEGTRPIGDVYLWLEPAEEPEIRLHLPKTPLINHLEIHPAHRRRGYGTKLVRTAEQKLASLGHRRVALAVEQDNHVATHLYRRLDYADWPHPRITCLTFTDGTAPRQVEICRVMVKELAQEHR